MPLPPSCSSPQACAHSTVRQRLAPCVPLVFCPWCSVPAIPHGVTLRQPSLKVLLALGDRDSILPGGSQRDSCSRVTQGPGLPWTVPCKFGSLEEAILDTSKHPSTWLDAAQV